MLFRSARWFAFAVILVAAAQAQPLMVDLLFGPGPDTYVRAIAIQSDDRVLIGGGFTRVSNLPRTYLARINADGTLDPGFNPTLSGPVETIAVQSDGRILVGGRFATVNDQDRRRLVRLNADGSIDASFNPAIEGNAVRAVLVLPGNTILIGGDFSSVSGQSRAALARLNADGSLDPSFIGDVSGRTIPSAIPGVYALARQLDGRIVLGGQFAQINGQPRRALGRVSADGVLDTAFDPVGPTASPSIHVVTALRDGGFLVGGEIAQMEGLPRLNLARFRADGRVETTFNPGATNKVYALTEQTDGKILIGGSFGGIAGVARQLFGRVNADGTIDESFIFNVNPAIPQAEAPGVQAITLSPAGRIVFGGSISQVGSSVRPNLARLVPIAPAFATPARSVSMTAGDNFIIAQPAHGAPENYQWLKNGVPIAGATTTSLTFSPVRLSDAGIYTLVASNILGAATSAPITVTVLTPPVLTLQPLSLTVLTGQFVSFSVAANGIPEPGFQWRKNGTAIPGATQSTFSIAVVQITDAGSYTCFVSNSVGAVTSAPATLTVLPRAQLANVSVRSALAASQSLIVGFVVSDGTAPMLVRAAGPALAQFGLTTAMTDPRIEFFRDATKLAENDNWPGTLAATFASVGGFSFLPGSRDAALLEPVTGGRSVVASGTGGGVVLVEAYDTGAAGGARLVNLSARNLVGAGDDILIAGFAISGNGTLRVLIRAVGPTIGGPPFGVPGVLIDPKLELFDNSGAKIGENDNWDAAAGALFGGVGAFAFTPGSRDAALVATLSSARSYTVQVKGADGGTGVALVEIYELP